MNEIEPFSLAPTKPKADQDETVVALSKYTQRMRKVKVSKIRWMTRNPAIYFARVFIIIIIDIETLFELDPLNRSFYMLASFHLAHRLPHTFPIESKLIWFGMFADVCAPTTEKNED